jgi:hypothetical protein
MWICTWVIDKWPEYVENNQKGEEFTSHQLRDGKKSMASTYLRSPAARILKIATAVNCLFCRSLPPRGREKDELLRDDVNVSVFYIQIDATFEGRLPYSRSSALAIIQIKTAHGLSTSQGDSKHLLFFLFVGRN